MDQSQLNRTSARKRRRNQNQNVAGFTPPPVDYESHSSQDLPYDVIFEILQRLRVKSLLRFKCICKSVETLISDPKFAKQHLSHSNSNRQLVVPSIVAKPSITRITGSVYRVLGSCNGLVCIYNICKGYVRLFNPSTRLRSKISPKIAVGMITISGFGYDHVNDKYKVFVTARDFDKTVTQIYTFGEESWRTIENLSYVPLRWSLSSATFVSGTLNWVARRGDVTSNEFTILSFDLEKETFGEVLLPQHNGYYKNCEPVMDVDVDVSSKCLRVCLKYNKTYWAMWRLNEYGKVESWTKLMMIPDYKFWHRNWRPFMDQFCISNKGVVDMDSELVLYDSISDDTGFRFPKVSRDCQSHLYIHEESLVSPPC